MPEHAGQTKAERVRQAFLEQSAYCERLGSRFTARLCETLAESLSAAQACARQILQWQGDPAALADGLPLRVAGALHALARSGTSPQLSSLYPPVPLPGKAAFAEVLEEVFDEHAEYLIEFLRHAPQTNEVGRSGVLMPGFLEIAARMKLPLCLCEIGASAGLNLVPDRYGYRFGMAKWGDEDAAPIMVPEWKGPAPPVKASLAIIDRAGCDKHPLDLRDPLQRERLMAYVWPDQPERMRRLQQAIDTALPDYALVDECEAADWVERKISAPRKGAAQVLFHSIVWNYLPEETRRRIFEHMNELGASRGSEAPLAWLRFELEEKAAALRLSLWPGRKDELLAMAHPHGKSVEWLGS